MFGILATVMGAVLTLIVVHILNITVSNFTFITYLASSFPVFCFYVSVQFPLYFKYEFSQVTAFAMLPVILIFIIGFILTKHMEQFSTITKFFIQSQNIVLPLGIFASFIILIISCFLSCAIYKKREL